MKKLVLILTVLLAVTWASVALGVVGPWKVVATGSSDSYASASADIKKPAAIAVRAYGKDLEVSGYYSCEIPDTQVVEGQVLVFNLTTAKSCSARVSATHNSYDTEGTVRVQILKK